MTVPSPGPGAGEFRLILDTELQPSLLVSFQGRERLHTGGRFRAACDFPAGVPPREIVALVGRKAWLTFAGHLEARRFEGRVRRVHVGPTDAEGRIRATLTITSPFDRLRDRSTRRVFRDRSSVEIIGALFAAHGIEHRFELEKSYPKREMCVQLGETDLAFVQRLVAEEGMCLYHRDPGESAGGEIVITDQAASLKPLPGEPLLVAPRGQSADPGGILHENHLRALTMTEKDGPDFVHVRHYDPMRPRATLESSARWSQEHPPRPGKSESAETPAEPHGELGLVYDSHAEDDSIAIDRPKARLLLEQLRRRARALSAVANCVRLAPGRTFVLSHETEPSLDGEYVITELLHDYRLPEASTSATSPIYEARLSARPAGVLPRPAPPKRRPVDVTETAEVVGPPGQEIHVDEHGRVKVQFHWDLDGTKDDSSSCWVRVALPWAGPGFGAMFVPRVGMEVLVTFLGGDPDRPVIVGALHHRAHPPPFHLPRAKTVSGVLTRSSPTGNGGHELSFEDAKGRELLRLASERDLEASAKNDMRVEVGGNASTNVVGDATRVVHGTLTDRVVGGANVEVQGPSTSLSTGDVSTVVMGKRKEHFEDLASTVFAAGTKIVSEGAYQLHVEGDYALSVGTGDTTAQTSVEGRLVLAASKTITLQSQDGLRLQVGTSVLEITAEGIKLTGPKLTLKAEEITAEGDGPKLTLADDAELVADKVALYSKKGGLEMDDETQLWGQKLKLNPNRSGPTKSDSSEEQKTKPFKLKLTDADMDPYAAKTYVLFADGTRYEGKTGADGEIEIDIPETTTVVDVTLYVDEYPTGRKKTWSIKVAKLPAANTWPGALMRLHNLGYYEHAPKEVPTAIEAGALKWFQKDHQLDETGELDGATSGELERVHGS
jgi:type VI secretion system secreted protein VgrG